MISSVLSTAPSVEPAYLAGAIGMTAGVLGVAVAIYLQLLAEDYCPPIYVAEFFVFGAALILLNAAIVNQQAVVFGDWLPVVGNALLLLGELYGIRYVARQVTLKQAVADLGASPDERH
jgi:hypothetical protein